jgi:hypothetical protein
MVQKYRNPSVVSTEKGPQMSMWIRSKGSSQMLLWDWKGKCFCLAKGQILQMVWLTFLFLWVGSQSERIAVLEEEGWSRKIERAVAGNQICK